MKAVARPCSWVLFGLLLTLVGQVTAQVPNEKGSDQPEAKLPALVSSQPAKEDPRDDELRKLLKARYNEALGELKDHYEHQEFANEHGVSLLNDQDHLYRLWQRFVQAGLDICNTPGEKVTLLTQYLKVTEEAEKTAQQRYEAGRWRIGDLHRARYERLDAEIQLLRAKREADNAKDR